MQWYDRRKPHQLAWAVGFFIYAAAAGMEWYSEFTQHWDPTIYRVYIVFAASMVGFLMESTLERGAHSIREKRQAQESES